MRMGRLGIAGLLGVALGVMALSALGYTQAPETALRTSLRSGGELSMVAGRQLGETELLFGHPARVFASLGTTLDGGKVSGGGAALVEVWSGRSFRIELGLGYQGKQDEASRWSSDWDLLLQASAVPGSGSALSLAPTRRGLWVLYARRW